MNKGPCVFPSCIRAAFSSLNEKEKNPYWLASLAWASLEQELSLGQG